MRLLGLALLLAAISLAFAQISDCNCDPADPATLEQRNCSLTKEALARPADPPVFFLRDANPRKPNRWLAIPATVRKGLYRLADMTARERLQLWTAAIQKARELWGDQWGLAVNGDELRTQCQPHIHIGKLLPHVKTGKHLVVRSPAEIPVPRDGAGLWIHPEGGKLHVYMGERLTETVLLR